MIHTDRSSDFSAAILREALPNQVLMYVCAGLLKYKKNKEILSMGHDEIILSKKLLEAFSCQHQFCVFIIIHVITNTNPVKNML